MKFKIHVKSKNSDWWEQYNEITDDCRKWAESIIERFNSTLKPFESPRELLGVEVISSGNENSHKWEKLITGMSVFFRGSIVDLMRCTKCGITGKRRGLSSAIVIDSKYRKKVYRNCDTAQKEMNFRNSL
jgi:hypothetical protein